MARWPIRSSSLHSVATDEILMSNDNWKNNQQAEIAATGLAPANDFEAALVITLAPGAYTVIERGKLETTGVGLLEIYDLDAGVGPELANISTRGFVATESNVMIAGFIIANSASESDQVIVRGLGPSLGAFGIANPLADPDPRTARRQRHPSCDKRQLERHAADRD